MKETNRQAGRQADRQTDRQIDRQIDIQTVKYPGREREREREKGIKDKERRSLTAITKTYKTSTLIVDMIEDNGKKTCRSR